MINFSALACQGIAPTSTAVKNFGGFGGFGRELV
jgi:hypothetical protein